MANLINKDALATEIEKRLNYRIESLKAINDSTYWKKEQSKDEFNKSLTRCAFNAVKNELFELKCFIDTLEVKEVDLDKMLTEFIGRYAYENGGEYPSTIDIAKHFFELGLEAHKKG